MKRSEINRRMKAACDFFQAMNFHLPVWAHWGPRKWQEMRATIGTTISEIQENQLGWDLTDFGSGDFSKRGLLLFTLRNGNHRRGLKKTYAEKIMVVEDGQETPCHFHHFKMEDIINRGGGNLVLQLWPRGPNNSLGGEGLRVSVDGVVRPIESGGLVSLHPGESITLEPGVYHRFFGKGKVLVGEVSMVNDDTTDNYFFEPVGRFPKIEEDEAPLFPLAVDLASIFRHEPG